MISTNSSSADAASLLPAFDVLDKIDFKSLDMDRLWTTAVSHGKEIDLIWHLLIYLPLAYTTLPKQYMSNKVAKRQKLPWIRLLIHISIGIFLVFRYQYRTLTSSTQPLPTTLDSSLAALNGALSLRLTRHEGRGNPLIARGSFQAYAIFLMFAAAITQYTQSPVWYHGIAKAHNGFVYVRWISILGWQGKFFENYGELYNFGIFFGGMLGMLEGFPNHGLPVVVTNTLLICLLAVVCKWTTARVTPKNAESNPFYRLMLVLGFAEYKTYKVLKEHEKGVTPEAEIKGAEANGKAAIKAD